jgi:hypothetical protein
MQKRGVERLEPFLVGMQRSPRGFEHRGPFEGVLGDGEQVFGPAQERSEAARGGLVRPSIRRCRGPFLSRRIRRCRGGLVQAPLA